MLYMDDFMKVKMISLALAVSILLGLSLSSCAGKNGKEKYSKSSFDYFDTVSVITGYADSQEEFDAVANEVLSKLEEYHKLYSIYHRFDGIENLCSINSAGGKPVKVDRKIIDMLLYSKQMHEATNGMLNIAMGSVLSLWHDYRTIGKDDPENASLPPQKSLNDASEHTDISKLIIDEENSTVTLSDPLMKLDVGAIAKGYATEQIALWLESEGISGYVLNIGGNVRTVGTKADGEGWTVGIENGAGEGYLAYLSLSGESVVTSGSYQRYYVVNGERYHHIIHPDTNMPAKGYLSVSVVCKDSGKADALSTALFCLPKDEGMTLVGLLDGVEAMWVTEDGDITVSDGWNNYIKK